MVSKNTRPGSRASSGKKPADRPSRQAKKPVTIDLEATSGKEKAVAAKMPEKVVKAPAAQAAKTVPGIGQKNGDKTGTGAADAKKDPVLKSTTASSVGRKDGKGVTPSSKKSQNDTSKKAPPKEPPKTKKPIEPKKAGSTGKLVTGIIGGVVALSGAYVLQLTGVIPAANKGDAALSENVAKLQSQISSLSSKMDSATKPDFTPLEKRLGLLEAQEKQRGENASIVGEAGKARNEKIVALGASLNALKETTAKLQNSISSGAAGENAGLATLAERVTSIENASNKAENLDAVTTKIEELAGKLTALSATVSSGKEGAGKKAAAEIASISEQLTKVEKQVSLGLTKASENLAGVETSMKASGETVAALGQRIDDLETSVSTPRKDEQRVARAIAVAGLKSAIDSGGGFSAALSLYEKLSGDPQSVASLKEYAETGIPDISSITASFTKLSNKIVQAATPKNDDGVMGRFLTNARSLVKVKSIGAIEGDSPGAIVSRVEAALKTSDLDAVLKEWNTLPDAAKAVSTDWAKQVKARSDANALIGNLLKQFMTSVTGTTN